ncbi:MAG TPA: alpha/beta fold hydrolase [Polyangiaceae bacterium]
MQGTARSGDVSIAYSSQGEGPETILLIAGLGCRAADWGQAFPGYLTERYRVVRFDNRGAGASSKPDDPFTLEDMAADAIAVLDAVQAARTHVVGVSMGGMIAQLLALDHPERCASLTLVSTNFGGRDVIAPTAEALALFRPPRGTTAEEITRLSMHVLTAPGFAQQHPEAVETMVRIAMAAPTPRRAFGAQLQAILESDRSERVRHITVPTLVIHGDSDTLIPAGNGRALAERIPGARFELVESCGHMPMWERPERLGGLVLDFLAQHASFHRGGTRRPAPLK